ncbi:hypothetical protein [Allokutzneria albata]|uniref:Extracellular repeat, HAF family n=1 Tax=Allokutzneria albata TaxID=211114 RepID=A0A1H0B523_ALLAB|nr:hypothetical protein [Allokutzneria albata]SDN40757.1 hypothetical protein SAMN04489726_6480 [Allokutzneria albata]
MRAVRLALPAVVTAVAAVVVGPGTTAAAEAACTWKAAALPLPTGMTQGRAVAADNAGGYAGIMMGSGPERVALWKPGTVVDYGQVPFAPYLVTVADVNRSGTVVGHGLRTMYTYGAWRSVGTRIEALPVPEGTYSATAKAVNDRGDIVGQYVRKLGEKGRAVMWPADRPGQMVELTGLPGTDTTVANDIDEDGTVLVDVVTANGSPTGYRWRGGVATKLVPPVASKDVSGEAISAGRVVGWISPADGSGLRAVQWDAAGKASFLPEGRSAQSVNRDGLVVGTGSGTVIWRNGKLEATLPSSPQLFAGKVGDDGGVPVYTRTDNKDTPLVYRCG